MILPRYLFTLVLLPFVLLLFGCSGGGSGDGDSGGTTSETRYQITTMAMPADGGSVVGDGRYVEGADFLLSATPDLGYAFERWEEDGETLQGDGSSTYAGQANGNRTIVAIFVPVSLEITPQSTALPVGKKIRFSAARRTEAGDSEGVTNDVTWSSSRPDLASFDIDSPGSLTGIAEGSLTVSATLGAQVATVSIPVVPAVPQSLVLSKQALDLIPDENYQVTATGHYPGGQSVDFTKDVAWTSLNEAIAEVSESGLITAKNEGTAEIEAFLGSLSASLTVTVENLSIISVVVTPDMKTIDQGARLQFRADGTFSDNSEKNVTDRVTWASENEDAAVISNTGPARGEALAVGVGETRISASFDGKTFPPVNLTVSDDNSVPVALFLSAKPNVVLAPEQGQQTEQVTLTAEVAKNDGYLVTDPVPVEFQVNSGSDLFALNPNQADTSQGIAEVTGSGSGAGLVSVGAKVDGTIAEDSAFIRIVDDFSAVFVGFRMSGPAILDGETLPGTFVLFNIVNTSNREFVVRNFKWFADEKLELNLAEDDPNFSGFRVTAGGLARILVYVEPAKEDLELRGSFTLWDPQSGEFEVSL